MGKKQKIILRKYRDGVSERKIAKELKINRTTVRRWFNPLFFGQFSVNGLGLFFHPA